MLYKYVKFTRQFKIRSMLKFFFSEGRNGDRRKFLDCSKCNFVGKYNKRPKSINSMT